jgi:hypothetical protein
MVPAQCKFSAPPGAQMEICSQPTERNYITNFKKLCGIRPAGDVGKAGT